MNNLLKFSVSKTPSNLARLVHSSRSSAASVTSTRPAKKFSIDSSDQLPMYASILQHNLNHMIKMSRQYEKNLNGISHTQKLIQKELEKDQPKISNIELKELIYLSKTDEDLDILAKAINRYLMDNRDSFSNTEYHNDFSRIFVELLYLLKKTSKALDYLHDPSLNRLFRSHRTCEVIYHLVAEANLYDEFISILKKNLPRYYKKTGFRSSETSGEISTNQQQNEGDVQQNKQQDPLIVPVSHMDIISRFLLKQNTSQALSVFKDLINRIERSGVEVGSFFKLRCIVLAILQNNGNMAFDLMKNKFCEKDLTMQTNLRVMIYSKLGRRDDCLRTLKNMFIYSNKLFPFTLKMLREDSEKLKDSSDVDFKDQIDFFYKRAFVDGRILEGEDLPELLSGAPMLNTDVFIPVEVNDRDELIDREIDAPPSLDQNSQQTQHQQQQYKFKRANFKSFNRS